MKKYIIGLFSAICLMGAGCTEFEDFTPVDMGEGPAVTVTAEKTAVDAFKVTITPAEGTVYYSYIVTDEAMTVDPDQLLQAKYEGSTLVKATEKPSVSGTLSNQNLGAMYYVYAVASNEKGVCGAVASASVELPDEEAPYLVNVPDGNKYKATNGGRSVVLTFNETVVRGSGAITYDVTKGNLTSYANGTIESVVINNESVTITLPESVVFDENEAVSYVFLDFAEGAFADAGGNVSAALVGGVDEETQTVAAPYWEYTPSSSGGGIEIEIDEAKGYGQYVFAGTSLVSSEPSYMEALMIYEGTTVAEVTGSPFDHDYGVMGFASAFSDDQSRFGILAGDISEDEATFNLETSMAESMSVCDIPLRDGSRVMVLMVVGEYNEITQELSISKDVSVPFVADVDEPLQLNTEKTIAYLVLNAAGTSIDGFIEILSDVKILPYRLVSAASIAPSLEPSINRAMKLNSIKAQLKSLDNIPVVRVRR